MEHKTYNNIDAYKIYHLSSLSFQSWAVSGSIIQLEPKMKCSAWHNAESTSTPQPMLWTEVKWLKSYVYPAIHEILITDAFWSEPTGYINKMSLKQN